MQDMCGCCQGELTGKPLGHCLSITGHDQDLSDLQQALAKHGHWQGEVHHRAPRGGASRTSLLHISTVNDSQGQPLYHVHIFSDITVRTRAEQKARHLAAHDALTGLFNRSSMLERIQDSIQQQQPFAILFIDLDKFKPVNDLHGHRTGDEVLCLTAERLRQLTRKQDVLARMGGDEFLVLLSLSNGSDFIYRIAADITRHLARPFDINGTLIEIESSVGIALYPGHGDNADALTHAADLAMYAAKRSGGNRYCLANGTKET